MGVYRVDRLTGETFTTIGDPVFARVTDIHVIEETIEPVYNESGGFPWIILGGAIAGLLLLLLILTGAIIGAKRRRRAQNKASSSYTDGYINDANTDREYMTVENDILADMRSRFGAMNGNGYSNGHTNITNGHANGNSSGLSNRHNNGYNGANGIAPYEETPTGFDPISDNSQNVYAGTISNGSIDSSNTSYGGGSQSNGNGVPVGGIAVVGLTGAATPNVKQRKYKSHKSPTRGKKKTLPKDPEFELSGVSKKGTMIQRLVHRMRNRLSTVRWSRDDRDDDGHGPSDNEAPTIQAIGPEKTGPPPKGHKGEIPVQLHPPPRGYAPASHSVPASHVRRSVGEAKGKAVRRQLKHVVSIDVPDADD